MSYAIIAFGAIGQALARAFARKNIEVSVAARQVGFSGITEFHAAQCHTLVKGWFGRRPD